MFDYLNTLLPSRLQSRPAKALVPEKTLSQTMLENQQQILYALNQINRDQFELRSATQAGFQHLHQSQMAFQQKILSRQEKLESRQQQFFQEQRFMMNQLDAFKNRILSLHR